MAPANRSTIRALVERQLGVPLDRWVRTRRADGMSWRRLSLALGDQVGVDVSHETLRLWFGGVEDEPAA